VNSIRTRLLVTLLAVVLVGAGVGAAVTYRNVLAQTEVLFDYQLRQMALSLRNQGFISADEAAALADDELDFVVQIWSVDGTHIYASRPTLVLPPQAVLGYADVKIGGKTWRLFTTVTRDRAIQVAQPLAVRRELAAQAALRGAMPMLALAPFLALAIWWTVGGSLRRLGHVVAEVRKRDAGALDPVPEAALPREIAPLVFSFNALLGKLRHALDKQRAFVADAAHELRSPLTALSLQVQLLRRTTDEEERGAAMASLSAGIERARRLVEQLLALARTEDASQTAQGSSTDVSDAARSAIADVVPLADQKHVDLEFAGADGAQVRGDGPALRILLRNLVDNAVRYSPQSGRVRVTVEKDAGSVRVSVDDSGPGIAPADRQRVFDRFYRGGSGGGETGSGLGLAIVRRIAERHGASLQLQESPLGGLQVQVAFPHVGGVA